jgi:hypothetical protein
LKRRGELDADEEAWLRGDNTFIEDRKAMQKSALIVLTDDGGDLAVYDRANKRNVTELHSASLIVIPLTSMNCLMTTSRISQTGHSLFGL